MTGCGSPVRAGAAIHRVNEDGQNHHPELTKRLKEVEAGLERFQRAFRVLAMGVDYQSYARFELLVPWVPYFVDGHREVRAVPGLAPGDEEYQFCKQFVIETALHLAELDFDLDLYEVYRDYQKRQQVTAAKPGPGES